MNKLAQLQTDDSLEQEVKNPNHKKDLSDSEALFLKLKAEKEIRVKLAEFRTELSNARQQRKRSKSRK